MFGAIHALAATPDPALADTSGCTALIDIVQESLRGEIEVTCPPSDKVACESKNGQIRALLEIIDQRRKRNADECDTLAQVNLAAPHAAAEVLTPARLSGGSSRTAGSPPPPQ